jgi:gliding motility-associated-like protein
MTDDGGVCVATDSIRITVIDPNTLDCGQVLLPKAFTPNGDGSNELFMPKAVGVKKFQMEIFDRWGQLLYSTSDIEKGWDGRAKKGGDILPQDVYVYKITVTQNTSKPKQYVGHITLIK